MHTMYQKLAKRISVCVAATMSSFSFSFFFFFFQSVLGQGRNSQSDIHGQKLSCRLLQLSGMLNEENIRGEGGGEKVHVDHVFRLRYCSVFIVAYQLRFSF